jgi:hypothetical protein
MQEYVEVIFIILIILSLPPLATPLILNWEILSLWVMEAIAQITGVDGFQ